MARRIFLNASGLLVSKAGRDALSSNPEDLLVDTVRLNTQSYLSGRLQGTGYDAGDFTTNYRQYRISVQHGLGYIPLFNAVHLGGGSAHILIDETNLTFQYYQQYSGSPSAPPPAPGYVDYLIFKQRWFF